MADCYGLSQQCHLFGLALSTDMVVQGGVNSSIVSQFTAGPLFWAYAVFFVGSIGVMFQAVLSARRHALTPALRRRMTYLIVTFAGPGLATFPYLVIAGGYLPFPEEPILLLASMVSFGVMPMITVMTYSVGLQEMNIPDRLVKHDFVRWLLYGPMVGVTIILCIQTVPWFEYVIGIPGDTLIVFAVMIMTVFMPMLITRIRPYLDALVYRQDQAEIRYLRNLPRSTFTRTDLRQLLENTLIAVCGALRAETGFVVGPGGKEGYTVKALCGLRRDVKQFVADYPLQNVMPQVAQMHQRAMDTLPSQDDFLQRGPFRLLPLRSPDGIFLGALGIAYEPGLVHEQGALSADSRRLIDVLARQMEMALTTVEMQQRIFDTLRNLGPEMQSLHHLTSQFEQVAAQDLEHHETPVQLQPQFPQMVKDALTHYWGGPKLSDSPLLGLRSVRRLLQEQGGSPTRALQGVLRQAITNLRPDEQLDPSAQEWLLYTILEQRYLQGKRIREIADHLAMSESEFYRKQRVAIDAVARQLALMEDSELIA
ncbi:MAG: sigma-70 family RNA polymerase sigma factor [Chloroflexaceae bacterium]|nr:sigma-70 family RNA polymerase sigma factor [Chloroflexaceae bacterium]